MKYIIAVLLLVLMVGCAQETKPEQEVSGGVDPTPLIYRVLKRKQDNKFIMQRYFPDKGWSDISKLEWENEGQAYCMLDMVERLEADIRE
jgi:hypothetical protein